MTPRQRIEVECARRGRGEVAAACAALVTGTAGAPDPHLIRVLAGDTADWHLTDPDAPGRDGWLRVWGARGLLWSWDGRHVRALASALGDPHWRVRELAAKVVARHGVATLFDEVAVRRADPNARVRAAAERAVLRLGATGA